MGIFRSIFGFKAILTSQGCILKKNLKRFLGFLFRRQEGTHLGTQRSCHLKLFCWNSILFWEQRDPLPSEAQSWRKRNMIHQCSHERAPASAHASAHASVHECAHKSWLFLCYKLSIIHTQRLPLECSRECSRGCPRKCTRSGLVVCHLLCSRLLCSWPISRTEKHPRPLGGSWGRRPRETFSGFPSKWSTASQFLAYFLSLSRWLKSSGL